jgi:hypothetical protein
MVIQLSVLAPKLSTTIAKIPVLSQIPTLIDQPPIPIYLDEQLTGIAIDSESKSIAINTDTEAKTDGSTPDVSQQAIANSVTINLKARKDSLSLLLLSALLDLCYDKLASKEYAITYLSGPVTVWRGVLQDFTIDQNADSELALIKIQLSKGSKNPQKPNSVPTLNGVVGALPGG